MFDRALTEEGGDPSESRTISPGRLSGVNGDTGFSSPSSVPAPVPSAPSFSRQAPSSRSVSVRDPPVGSSFDGKCAELLGAVNTPGDYDHSTHDELHDLCRGRVYAREESEAVWKIRMSTTDAAGVADAVDT